MDKQQIWDMYFAGICSLQFHPANKLPQTNAETIHYAAQIADLMMIERKRHAMD